MNFQEIEMKYQLLLSFCFTLIFFTDNKHLLVETEDDYESKLEMKKNKKEGIYDIVAFSNKRG